MPKTPPKGHLSRKPPLPSSDRSKIEEWIEGVMPAIAPLVARLDEIVRELLPDPKRYAIKWSKAYYATGERGWVIELAAYHRSVNVVFLSGSQFHPPPPLGSVGPARFVKLTDLAEAEDLQLHDWIRQAATTDGWKWD